MAITKPLQIQSNVTLRVDNHLTCDGAAFGLRFFPELLSCFASGTPTVVTYPRQTLLKDPISSSQIQKPNCKRPRKIGIWCGSWRGAFGQSTFCAGQKHETPTLGIRHLLNHGQCCSLAPNDSTLLYRRKERVYVPLRQSPVFSFS